jgi:aminoglycoside phosphotransferase (APT) family kinase protein
LSSPEERLFENARRRSAALEGSEVPLVWSHGDLAVGNVCRLRRRIGIMDWAGAEPGLPMLDLFFFLMSYLSRPLRDTGSRLLRFRQAFGLAPGGGVLVSAARSMVRRYESALELDHRWPALLLVLTWVLRAKAHHEKAERTTKMEDVPGEPNLPAAYVRVLGEEAERVFAAPLFSRPRRRRE